MAVVTEGGYDLHAFGTSLDLVAETLVSPLSPPQWPGAEIRSVRGAAAVAATTRSLSDIWRF